jgi:hypothetical protein
MCRGALGIAMAQAPDFRPVAFPVNEWIIRWRLAVCRYAHGLADMAGRFLCIMTPVIPVAQRDERHPVTQSGHDVRRPAGGAVNAAQPSRMLGDVTQQISDIETLEAIYGAPLTASIKKEVDHIHRQYQKSIEAAPFAVLAIFKIPGAHGHLTRNCSARSLRGQLLNHRLKTRI